MAYRAWIDESQSEVRKDKAQYSGGGAADISVQAPHLTDITDARQMCTNDALGSFTQPLQNLSVLGCAQTMPFCDVFSQDAF